jgi:hypothetical protein
MGLYISLRPSLFPKRFFYQMLELVGGNHFKANRCGL